MNTVLKLLSHCCQKGEQREQKDQRREQRRK
jgi:hypothetical protein